MRILVDITHPAHVHFFRRPIERWRADGHEVIVTSREKDLTTRLLDGFGFDHTVLSEIGASRFGLAGEMASHCRNLAAVVRRTRPAVMASIAGTFTAPVGILTRTPTVTFYDTENATLSNLIAYPLTTVLAVPACYRGRTFRQAVRYRGYHELSYLHPNYFTPDPAIRAELGVGSDEPYAILRFVSWGAAHDIGHKGISEAMKRRAVEAFSAHARVFISSEKPLAPELEPYRLPIQPERIHHALAFAALIFGESATMASECAVLGTPAIYLDDAGRGYTDEQARIYGAVETFTESPEDQERAIKAGVRLLTTPDAKHLWTEKRDRILADTIDVAAFAADLVVRTGGG